MSQINDFFRRRAAAANTPSSDASRASRTVAKVKARTNKQLDSAKDFMTSSFDKVPFKKLNLTAEPLKHLFKKPGAATPPSSTSPVVSTDLPKDPASVAMQHQVAAQLIDGIAPSAVQQGLFRVPGRITEYKGAMTSLRNQQMPDVSNLTVDAKSSLLKSMLLKGYEIFPNSYMRDGTPIEDSQQAQVVAKAESLLKDIEANKDQNLMTVRNIATGAPILFNVYPEASHDITVHNEKIDEIVKFLERILGQRDDATPAAEPREPAAPKRQPMVVKRKPLPILDRPDLGDKFLTTIPDHLLDEDTLKKK